MTDRSLRSSVAPPDEQRPKAAAWSRGCTRVDRWLQIWSGPAVNSLVWRVLIVLFALLLLFGSPIQFWVVPATGDYAFDALYLLGFTFCWVDIIFNAYSDPHYFVCDPCNRKLRRTNPNSVYHPRFWTSGFGSYNFWCDFLSTGGFLYDVSFVNPAQFAMQVTYIALDGIGVPVRGIPFSD